MTILEVVQLIACLASAGKDIQAIVDDLRAKGHPDSAPIPDEHQAAIAAIVKAARPFGAHAVNDGLGDPYAGE
jgi:hypothetical protein